MSSVLGSNLTALFAQRGLATTQSALANSVERMSSGLRINRAKDDAAGEAAAAAAKARAEVNVEQYARASKEVMQVAAQQIQGYLRDSGRNLNVTLDESTGKYVARVVNPETGEVVRSLPSEETLRIARNIDQMRGMLVNQRA